jgi:hypothetical protein
LSEIKSGKFIEELQSLKSLPPEELKKRYYAREIEPEI